MPRKESTAFPEGNDPIPYYVMPGGIILEDSEMRGEILIEIKEDLRRLDQSLVGLEHEARHPRPAMKADGPVDNKTRERTEGAATVVQVMHGDSCNARRVQNGPKTSTCFGVMAELTALPCRDDVVRRSSPVSHPWRCA